MTFTLVKSNDDLHDKKTEHLEILAEIDNTLAIELAIA